MPRPTLLVVPTDAHLESALRDRTETGAAARTARTMLADAIDALVQSRALARAETARVAARDAVTWLASGAPELAIEDEPVARTMLAHALDDTLGALRRATATPDDLREAAGRGGHTDVRANARSARDRARDGLAAEQPARGASARAAGLVARAWEHVDAALEGAKLLDARGAGTALAEAFARADAASLELVTPPDADVRFRGRLGFSADDLTWIEALHRRLRAHGGSVTVELPRGTLAEAEGVDALADTLERRWASLPDAPEIDWIAQPTSEGGRALVVEAKSAEAEARAAVAAVVDAAARGIAPERIALVVPAVDEARLDPIRALLEEAGVPFTEPRGRAVTASPDARAALAMLSLAEGPVARGDIVDLLRAPGIHPGAWVDRASERGARARAAALATRLRELPVRFDRSGQVLLEALSEAIRLRPGARADARDDWMPRALGRILASLRVLGAPATRSERVRRFVALLDTTRLGNPSAADLAAALRDELAASEGAGSGNGMRGGGRSGAALAALGECASAVRALRGASRALSDAASTLGSASAAMTPLELAMELERAVSDERRGAMRAASIRVVRPGDLCGLEVDVAIVMGLDGSAYGGHQPSPPLLDERLCAALPSPIRPPHAAELRARARAELSWAIAGAREVVYCWASSRDGEETTPDPWIRRAARDAAVRVEPASRVERRSSAVSPRAQALVSLAGGGTAPPDIAVRAAIERARMAFFFDPRVAPSRHTGMLPLCDPRDRAHLVACVGGSAPDHPIAVTHIERAMGCAFAGFARRVLHVRRVEDAAEAGDPRERGTMVHRALRAAFEAARRRPNDDAERILEIARSAAAGALGLDEARTPLRREAIERAVSDAVRAVAAAIEADEPVHFWLAEQRFGPGEPSPWEALEIAEAGGPSVYVEGQIDRIDRSTDGRLVRVVDYKTGKKPELADLGVTSLQLPLYAAAAARAASASEALGVYIRIASRGGVEIVPADWDKQRASVASRDEALVAARRRVLALHDGQIAPRPLRATLCTSCDARDVCRRPAVAPIEEAP